MSTEEIDHSYTDECICPYCGYEESDSWELGSGAEDDGETDCGSCGKTYLYSRQISVTYSTMPKPDVQSVETKSN